MQIMQGFSFFLKSSYSVNPPRRTVFVLVNYTLCLYNTDDDKQGHLQATVAR